MTDTQPKSTKVASQVAAVALLAMLVVIAGAVTIAIVEAIL